MKYHLIIYLCFFSLGGFAQQSYVLGFFRNAAPYYNPATSGLEHSFQASLLYRNQWTDLPGAPSNYLGQIGTRLKNINSGIGLNVMHNEIGFSRSTSITGNYSYQWSLNNGQSSLSVGVAPKFYHLQFAQIYSDSATAVSSPEKWNRSSAVTANLGAAFKGEKLFLGLSAMNLIPTEKQLGDDFNFNHPVQFSLMSSYDLILSDQFKLTPLVHVLTDFVSINPLINLRAEHKKLWYQLGYKRNVMAAGVGYRFFGKINVGYMISYFFKTTVFNWTHEAFIAYELK